MPSIVSQAMPAVSVTIPCPPKMQARNCEYKAIHLTCRAPSNATSNQILQLPSLIKTHPSLKIQPKKESWVLKTTTSCPPACKSSWGRSSGSSSKRKQAHHPGSRGEIQEILFCLKNAVMCMLLQYK
eukprot:871099-Pelagomonas_calceolata.AAC.10